MITGFNRTGRNTADIAKRTSWVAPRNIPGRISSIQLMSFKKRFRIQLDGVLVKKVTGAFRIALTILPWSSLDDLSAIV